MNLRTLAFSVLVTLMLVSAGAASADECEKECRRDGNACLMRCDHYLDIDLYMACKDGCNNDYRECTQDCDGAESANDIVSGRYAATASNLGQRPQSARSTKNTLYLDAQDSVVATPVAGAARH